MALVSQKNLTSDTTPLPSATAVMQSQACLSLHQVGLQLIPSAVRPEETRMQQEDTKMYWIGWVVLVLALIEAGWLAFDGGHALIVGDYVTPTSGQHAGQLGPWAQIVSAVGIDPRSTLMKSMHLALGLAWLGVMVCFALRLPLAWWGMLGCAVLGLWYLPFGTILSVVQIALLLLPAVRGQGS